MQISSGCRGVGVVKKVDDVFNFVRPMHSTHSKFLEKRRKLLLMQPLG